MSSRINQTLQSNDEALLSAVDASNVGITISDPALPDLPLIYANQAFSRMTGYRVEEVLGQNCRFLQGPQTDKNAVEKIRTAIQNSQDLRIELLNYRKNGEMFWNNLYLQPVQGPENSISHFIGVQHDVTNERILGEEIDRLTTMLQDRDHDVKTLRDKTGHTLYQRLDKIIDIAQNLLESFPEKSENLQQICQETSNIKQTLKELITFFDASLLPVSFGPVDLNQSYLTAQKQKNITAEQVTLKSSHLPSLLANFGQMLFLFKTLIDLAQRFRCEGKKPSLYFTARAIENQDLPIQAMIASAGGYRLVAHYEFVNFPFEYVRKIDNFLANIPDVTPETIGVFALAACRKIARHYRGDLTIQQHARDKMDIVIDLVGWPGRIVP